MGCHAQPAERSGGSCSTRRRLRFNCARVSRRPLDYFFLCLDEQNTRLLSICHSVLSDGDAATMSLIISMISSPSFLFLLALDLLCISYLALSTLARRRFKQQHSKRAALLAQAGLETDSTVAGFFHPYWSALFNLVAMKQS